ncbi:MAG: phosphatase PAP2 family protein [Altererythrobacter sp.]|nr:phosphatase PAP2 family protein [Altererythrobacter sp.]
MKAWLPGAERLRRLLPEPVARLAVDAVLRLGRTKTGTLASVALLVAAVAGFIKTAEEMLKGHTQALDRAILLALREHADLSDPVGPPWVEEMARDFTALGGVAVLTLITLSAAGFLALRRQPRAMWFVLLSVAGGQLLSTLLKHGFNRPRPELVPHETVVYSASFPSGHSAMAAITYLTLGLLLARFQPDRQVKVYLLALAVFVTIAVGVSRVYLGVHWPTDVLAGWTLGAAWAIGCRIVALRFQKTGEIESTPAETTQDRETP